MALQGDLGDFPLVDLIQLIDLSKKTGGVLITGRRGQQHLEGWLYFRDGKICGASLGSLPPLEAVYTFFTLTSGPFRFHDDAVLDAPTITQSNEMIIMEGIMRQESWTDIQQQVPSLTMVPRLVPNPASTGGEISLEPEEWRVLTMVNGRNTVGQIASRSGLGELRACEIIARLLGSGLIEQRDLNLGDALFPDLEKMATAALGPAARTLLDDSCTKAGIKQRSDATGDQVAAALKQFELVVTRTYGPQRVSRLLEDMRAHTQHVLSGA